MAVVQFIVQRNSFHYIICTFLPCLVMIILCYSTLWLNTNDNTQHLCVHLFASGILMLFQYVSTCLIYPVSYLKAMDVFVGICLCFSIFPLLETFRFKGVANNVEKGNLLTRFTSSQMHEQGIHWIEVGLKIVLPVLFMFSVLLFYFIFVKF